MRLASIRASLWLFLVLPASVFLACEDDATTPVAGGDAGTPSGNDAATPSPAEAGADTAEAGCTGEECPPTGPRGTITVACSTFQNRPAQTITVAFLDGTTVVEKKSSPVGPGTGNCRFTLSADKNKDYGIRFYVDQNGNGTCDATGDYVVKMADVNLSKLMTDDITIGIGENYPAGDCSAFQ